MKRESLPPCPECGGNRTVSVYYGLPTESALEAIRRGEIVLGGCEVRIEGPLWACSACRHRWGRLDELKFGPEEMIEMLEFLAELMSEEDKTTEETP